MQDLRAKLDLVLKRLCDHEETFDRVPSPLIFLDEETFALLRTQRGRSTYGAIITQAIMTLHATVTSEDLKAASRAIKARRSRRGKRGPAGVTASITTKALEIAQAAADQSGLQLRRAIEAFLFLHLWANEMTQGRSKG